MSGPEQPYGGYGAPSQPYSPYPYGQLAQPPAEDTTIATVPPPAPRKSRRGLWITLGVIAAVLMLLGGGGVYAVGLYFAPAAAAGAFCADLKAHNYQAAYSLFSSGVRAQITSEQFVQGSQQLDTVEGAVTACGGGSGYSHNLGSGTASVTATITRGTAGTLRGTVRLKNENGAWKVSGLDTSLLGVNMGALAAAGAFCAALQSQNYTAAYALLGALPQANIKQSDFIQGGQAHDQIDGTVTTCALAGLGQPNDDSTATLTVSIARSKLGTKQGVVTLDYESGAWKVAGVAPALQGSDIGPLQVAAKLCADLISGNVTDAYQNLASSDLKASVTEAQFVAFFQLNPGETYTGCTPDYTTYKVSATGASFDAKITFGSSGQAYEVLTTLTFISESGAWKLEGIEVKPKS